MHYEIELRLPALASCLHVVTACVGRLCCTSLGSEDVAFQQAVHAACVRAIRCGYGGDSSDQRLELCFYAREGELLVELIDHGLPADTAAPMAAAGGDPSPPQVADEVRYERLEGGNRITLTRRCHATTKLDG